MKMVRLSQEYYSACAANEIIKSILNERCCKYLNVVSQLYCAVFSVICEMDTIKLLKNETGMTDVFLKKSNQNYKFANVSFRGEFKITLLILIQSFCYLVVLDGFSQRFHLHSLV